MWKRLIMGVLLVLVVLCPFAQVSGRAQRTFNPASTGTDYYYPSSYFAGCPNWTWLTSCYGQNPEGGLTAQALLGGDVRWMAANHMGQFQRVWVMLDQGIHWQDGQYAGLDATYLANLDDALATFHRAGIGVDLVLLEASKGSSDQYQFQTAALDGGHAALRQGYLAALGDLARHLAQNPVDRATVLVMDLFNEAYYQLEQFGLGDDAIHQWLVEAYAVVHGAAPVFAYTVSDTTRLLKEYGTWWPYYRDTTDIEDIHVYDDAPWDNVSLYARGASLPKPWFVGEAGCAPGHISCTYRGDVACSEPQTCALSVDSWWLAHLRSFGARAVLIEERNTAWAYPDGPTSQTPTLVGHVIQTAGQGPPP